MNKKNEKRNELILYIDHLFERIYSSEVKIFAMDSDGFFPLTSIWCVIGGGYNEQKEKGEKYELIFYDKFEEKNVDNKAKGAYRMTTSCFRSISWASTSFSDIHHSMRSKINHHIFIADFFFLPKYAK